MKLSKVVVSWKEECHFTHAVKLAKLAARFHSTILLKCNDEIADLRRSSIITIVALCAMASVLDLEVAGDDEQDAAQSVEQVFKL